MVASFDYFPFSGGPGADSGEDRWVEMMQWMRTTGIVSENNPLDSSTDDLAVTAASGLQVKVAVGKAFMEGTFFVQSDDYNYLDISANSSGDDRIDLVVLETDFIANVTIESVVEGTPDPSPVPPTPVQNTNLYQLPLAQVYVADTATYIDAMDITDERVRSTQGDSANITIDNGTADEELVTGSNPNFTVKGISAGTNTTLDSDANSVTINNVGAITASTTDVNANIDPNSSRVFKVTVEDDLTLTLIDFASATTSVKASVYVIQDGTGGHTITFSNALFPSGIQPPNTESANDVDLYEFEWNGTDWMLVNKTSAYS